MTTRRRRKVPGTCRDHKKQSRSTWQSPRTQQEEHVYLAVATSTRRRAMSLRRRADVPGSLHEQDLGLEACRGPLGGLQPSVSNGSHVVFEPWLIGDVVHHCHFLHTKITTKRKKREARLRHSVLIGEEREGEVHCCIMLYLSHGSLVMLYTTVISCTPRKGLNHAPKSSETQLAMAHW